MNNGFVYILTNIKRNVLYIGVTNNLIVRIQQHKSHEGSVFTQKYNVNILVWFEHHTNIVDAIAREKQLKNYHRQWKYNLIQSVNPDMIDLFEHLDEILNNCDLKSFCDKRKRDADPLASGQHDISQNSS